MIRIILYRIPNLGSAVEAAWQQGLLHAFTADGCAVVEDLVTAELRLIPVDPTRLKFAQTAEQWAEALKANQRPGTGPK